MEEAKGLEVTDVIAERDVELAEGLENMVNMLKEEAEANPKTQVLRAVLEGKRKDPEEITPLIQTQSMPELVTDVEGSPISTDEASILFGIMNEFRTNPKLDVYAALPTSIRNLINKQTADFGLTTLPEIKKFAGIMVGEMVKEMNLDKEFSDFQTNLSKELEIPSIMDMYAEHTKSMMEDGLEGKAKALEESNPEKAAYIRSISKAYKDSYTLDRQKELLATNATIITKMGKNTTKLFTRICDHFDYKMSKSQFRINKISEVIKALQCILPINDDMAKRYVVLLCKVCENYSIDKVDEVAFMYYSVNNIISLAYVSTDKATAFSTEVISNINALIELISDKDAEHYDI